MWKRVSSDLVGYIGYFKILWERANVISSMSNTMRKKFVGFFHFCIACSCVWLHKYYCSCWALYWDVSHFFLFRIEKGKRKYSCYFWYFLVGSDQELALIKNCHLNLNYICIMYKSSWRHFCRTQGILIPAFFF